MRLVTRTQKEAADPATVRRRGGTVRRRSNSTEAQQQYGDAATVRRIRRSSNSTETQQQYGGARTVRRSSNSTEAQQQYEDPAPVRRNSNTTILYIYYRITQFLSSQRLRAMSQTVVLTPSTLSSESFLPEVCDYRSAVHPGADDTAAQRHSGSSGRPSHGSDDHPLGRHPLSSSGGSASRATSRQRIQAAPAV